MKLKILIYLFLFTVLLVLFQYVNSKRVFADMNRKLEGYKTQLNKSKSKLAVLQDENLELAHFNLEKNDDALSYFENKGYNVSKLIPLIKDELYKLNESKGNHPLIPYASETGRHMMINTVKLLNHKWIIADFSDGQFWGEIFITYEVTETNTVTFKLVESFLYPLN